MYKKERSAILKAFMEVERHITAEELYRYMKDQGSSIGWNFMEAVVLVPGKISGR
ncbi:MAG: hypothetical protein ABGX83_02255 [Nitrospira sp.]